MQTLTMGSTKRGLLSTWISTLKTLLMMMSFIVLSETKLFQDQEVTETRAACYAENVTTKCTSARFS
jgi:hypothetical protein